MEPINTDSNGRFVPGNKAAVQRGPNKVSLKVKQSIVAFMERNVDGIQASFDELEAKEKLDFIAQLLPYVSPKMRSVEHEGQVTLDIQFKDAE